MKIWLWLGLSILSAVFYRLSGKGGFKGAKLIRRIGCPLLALGLFFTLKTPKLAHFWAYLLTYGVSVGAMSAYWSELQNPKDDVSGLEWGVTGFLYGLSAFPLVWAGVHWYSIFLRAIALAIFTAILSNNIKDVTIEEGSRGFLYIFSIPLLLI